jgi:hypothetical protein
MKLAGKNWSIGRQTHPNATLSTTNPTRSGKALNLHVAVGDHLCWHSPTCLWDFLDVTWNHSFLKKYSMRDWQWSKTDITLLSFSTQNASQHELYTQIGPHKIWAKIFALVIPIRIALLTTILKDSCMWNRSYTYEWTYQSTIVYTRSYTMLLTSHHTVHPPTRNINKTITANDESSAKLHSTHNVHRNTCLQSQAKTVIH